MCKFNISLAFYRLKCLLHVYYIGIRVMLLQLVTPVFDPRALPRQTGRVAVVTGGGRGIGLETGRRLAELGAHVILASNNEKEGNEAAQALRSDTGNDEVDFMHLDLRSLSSVRDFVNRFRSRKLPLHILVNNAGVMLVPLRLSADALEEHLAVNCVGPFLLTALLTGASEGPTPLRVVCVSSATHRAGRLLFHDINCSERYSSYAAYARSKLALTLWSRQLHEQGGGHVTSVAVDPGVVDSELYRHAGAFFRMGQWLTGRFLFRSTRQAAAGVTYAATAPELKGRPWAYLENGHQIEPAQAVEDVALRTRLWETCCLLSGHRWVLRPHGLKGPRVPSRPLPRVPRTPRIAFAALALGVAATGVKEARAHTQRHHPRAPGPRELRFSSFASLRFQGRPYMTPSDFVDSVTRNSPRAACRSLSPTDLVSLYFPITVHPSLPCPLISLSPRLPAPLFPCSPCLPTGLISYSDYLFLLCILTKPLAGFQIAFNMLDADGNQHIDKTEFLMVLLVAGDTREANSPSLCLSLCRCRWQAASVKRRGDTTLLVHLFGRNGDKELDYQDFYRFTTALQEEVVWREFQACAHGRHVISEGAFARVLLRYTDVRDAAAITENLAARVPAGQGISFEEFHSFFQFLNNLEDFSIAVQMYTRAGLAIGQDEFRRAVRVATGLHLSPHLVCTVFHLFDEDGDGRLSHTEFLGVMRDRLRRGARDHRTSPKKDDYRTCVRRELSR
ncbi:unnamed protein product [Lampetra planeri]